LDPIAGFQNISGVVLGENAKQNW